MPGKKSGPKLPSVRGMDRKGFWKIIDWSRAHAKTLDRQVKLIQKALESLEPEDIVEFNNQFWEREIEAYRWDLWDVGAIINGSCSDDGFTYFRGWLIAQGREFFEAVLREPARAAERVKRGKRRRVECEGMLYVAMNAYEKKTGEEMPPGRRLKFPAKPKGRRVGDWELPGLYPELWRRFIGDAK